MPPWSCGMAGSVPPAAHATHTVTRSNGGFLTARTPADRRWARTHRQCNCRGRPLTVRSAPTNRHCAARNRRPSFCAREKGNKHGPAVRRDPSNTTHSGSPLPVLFLVGTRTDLPHRGRSCHAHAAGGLPFHAMLCPPPPPPGTCTAGLLRPERGSWSNGNNQLTVRLS